jgi:hypothetical protein
VTVVEIFANAPLKTSQCERGVMALSFSRQRRARSANQLIRFYESVVIVRLFSCKKADGYQRRANSKPTSIIFLCVRLSAL